MSRFLPFIFFLFLFSCKGEYDHKGKTPLVQIGDNFLYKEDLGSSLPLDISSDDSLLFVEHYIQSWAEDILLYEKAQKNIPTTVDVEELVENYRKSLIIHTYQQELIKQKLEAEISENEMLAYYEKNQELFRLDRPMIKGLFIKVPQSAPQIREVRKWYKDTAQVAVERLEKYSLQNAVIYEYFYDKWINVSDILSLLPKEYQQTGDLLLDKRNIELKDSTFFYFCNLVDRKKVGDIEPFESAKNKIKDLLINLHQVEFIQKIKKDLYKHAVNSNRIKYKY